MNILPINKTFLALLCFFILTSCSTKTVYEKIKIKKYQLPLVEEFEVKNIFIDYKNINEINYDSKIEIKNNKKEEYFEKNIIKNNLLYRLTNDLKIIEINFETEKLISTTKINYFIDSYIITSFSYVSE